jgi:hypothetical protein
MEMPSTKGMVVAVAVAVVLVVAVAVVPVAAMHEMGLQVVRPQHAASLTSMWPTRLLHTVLAISTRHPILRQEGVRLPPSSLRKDARAVLMVVSASVRLNETRAEVFSQPRDRGVKAPQARKRATIKHLLLLVTM